jgi:hypothetical protein
MGLLQSSRYGSLLNRQITALSDGSLTLKTDKQNRYSLTNQSYHSKFTGP